MTGAPVDCVVSDHLNAFASGVARFNEILADRLGVPLVGILDPRLPNATAPLLSFKVSELDDTEAALVEELHRTAGWRHQLYLHEWCGAPLEQLLVADAERVLCGNDEVLERVQAHTRRAVASWTPGLLLDQRRFRPAEIRVFSFGMAHKLQTKRFEQLRARLDATGSPYAVYVSSANHATASIRDAESVYREMSGIFPDNLYFMGNLSDVAVYNQLLAATFFASFFPDGVRANNTSIAAAMEQGAVVVTNLDDHSPAVLRHLDNVVNLDADDPLPVDPLVLRRIGVRAMETARARSWEHLVDQVQSGLPIDPTRSTA